MSFSQEPKKRYDEHYLSLKEWLLSSMEQTLSPELAALYTMEMRRVAFRSGIRVLEIGFGQGFFLDWAHQQGAQVTGIEIIPELCAHTRQRHPAVYEGFLPQLVEAGMLVGPFDLIVAFDVFEHLTRDELILYFQIFSGLLREGGEVLARFPNGQSPFGRVYQHGDITHQSTLTPYSMKQIGLMSGFVVKSVDNAARVVVGPLHKRIRWRLIYQARTIAEQMLGYLYFSGRLPLDPNLTVVLEKLRPR
ncbi:class I SAM-dependent methyltransferase [Myxococcota bacterium]|nr:class I SAM-dependent methyltransferase [Myxococcota bacterium]